MMLSSNPAEDILPVTKRDILNILRSQYNTLKLWPILTFMMIYTSLRWKTP